MTLKAYQYLPLQIIFSKIKSTGTLVPTITGFPYIFFGFDSIYFLQFSIFFFVRINLNSMFCNYLKWSIWKKHLTKKNISSWDGFEGCDHDRICTRRFIGLVFRGLWFFGGGVYKKYTKMNADISILCPVSSQYLLSYGIQIIIILWTGQDF